MFQGSGFSGASTASPFGQSAFGKPATTGFNAPVFGSTPGTLFSGTTTQQSGGLFGSTTTPAFGQPQTTQPAFGSSTGLFGAQQNATPGPGMFGSSSSAFGQAKPSFGFATQQPSSTALFGSQPQTAQTQQPSLFGQTANQTTTPGLFGGSTAGFGGGTTPATGGTTVKFAPVTGTDTMIKNGASSNISTRNHCITVMKEYENKSLEELRVEDYAANRKGPQQGAQSSLGLFGSSGQNTLFGANTSTGFGTGTTSNVFGSGSSSLFGKPAGTATAFGAPAATTSSSFGFNTTTPSNPFGTNAAQKPFGATTQTNIFGQTTQASQGFGTQPTSGFGAFGTQQNTSGGLFGQNKPTFNLGANTSNAFSFNQPTATNTSSSLFGNKSTMSFGTFGTPSSTTTTGFGTPAFGATTQNTSVFGNNFKPTTSFNFGTTSTTNTLGTGSNVGGSSVFGNNMWANNKPGMIGGNNSSLFGANTFGTASNTFGNAGSTTLGGLGNTSMSLGGLNNQQSGLGSNQNSLMNNPINQHMLAYASMPFGDSPLFKNLLPPTGKADELLKPTSPAAQKAMITGQNFKASPKNNSKIKVIPLESNTKKSLFDGLDGEEEAPSIDIMSGFGVRPSPKRLVLKHKQSYDISINSLYQRNGVNELSPIIKTSPRFSLKTSQSVRISTNVINVIKEVDVTNNNNEPEKTPEIRRFKSKNSLDSTPLENNTMAELCANKDNSNNQSLQINSSSQRRDSLNKTEITEQPSTNSSSVESEVDDSVPGVLDDSGSPHPTGVLLKRLGYYTIPHLDALSDLVDSEGHCLVENFTIGRLNYGNVFYPDPMDIAGLNLDEIVHFRHKEVIIYPDENQKPIVGEGLNRRAQVTLDRVWPVDKTNRMPITEPHRIDSMDYEGRLRRASAKHKTTFVEYRPQTGSWVFKVEHFSKYGLSDSDEEDNGAIDLKRQKLAPQAALQSTTVPQFPLKPVGGVLQHPTSMQIGDEDDEMDDGITSPFDLDEKMENKALSPTSKLGKQIGSSSHKVQLMKASFFQTEDLNIDGEYLDYDDIVDQPDYKINGYTFDPKHMAEALSWYNKKGFSRSKADSYFNLESETQEDDDVSTTSIKDKDENMFQEVPQYIPQSVQPKMYVLKYWKEVLPLEKTTIGSMDARCLADVGIFKGRSFTPGWGHSLQLTALGTMNAVTRDAVLNGRSLEDSSPQILQRICLKRSNDDEMKVSFQISAEAHLECSLKHTTFAQSEDGTPFVAPNVGFAGLHDHNLVAQQLIKNSSVDSEELLHASIWGLCQALWGYLPIDAEPTSHLSLMQRKIAVSEWLKSAVSQDVTDDLKLNPENSGSSFNKVYAYLTGNQVPEACHAAQKIGDFRMSLLISQCSSGPGVRTRVQQQLAQWRETEADQHVDTSRLKSMMLVAGIPVFNASDRQINTCCDLDWLRSFGLHLWYMTPFTGSLTDALIMYEKSFPDSNKSGFYAKSPLPSYIKTNLNDELENDDRIFDVRYHLLKLFSSKHHSLEPIFNPATYTTDCLDYRICWFLMRVLSSLGYSHVSEMAACMVHSSFAEQLEAEGLWHWAVFVLLHVPESVGRKNAIKDMINRHVIVNDLSEEEQFLLEKLNIPLAWVYEAKAQKAVFLGRYDDAAKFLIKSELWNESHTVIMDHISSKAIVNEKYEYLEILLSELSRNDRYKEIFNWDSAGGVILEYLNIVRQVEKMVAAQDLSIGFHLERLQPQLTGLCMKIKLLKVEKPIDRLSQAEMAKRISGLIQNLIVAHCSNESREGVNILAKLVRELPLAGDHSQWEWLKVMASWRISATDAITIH